MSDEVKYKIRESEYDALVAERDALKAENEKYRTEMDKINRGIPSEWAYAKLTEELAALKAENEKLKEDIELIERAPNEIVSYQRDAYMNRAYKAEAERDELLKSRDGLREALKIYANQETWKRAKYGDALDGIFLNEFLNSPWAPIVKDSGEIAREALKEFGGVE